jgi:C1A family cysteine protease
MKLRLFLIFSLIAGLLYGQNGTAAEPLKMDTLSLQAAREGWTVKDYGVKRSLGLKGHGKMPQVAVGKPKALKAAPSSLDWRNNNGNFVSSVKDQGNCGSCWAFAATGALESITMIASNKPGANLDLSEQVMVSCDTANQGCNGGYPDEAANYIKNPGLPVDSCFSYTATDAPCANACANWQATAYKATNWGYAATVSPDADSIKSALATYGPLTTTMMVYEDLFYYSSGIYKYTSGSRQGGHAILIVGYDDGGQYFIVKNSWGTSWGENGYFRIAYSELQGKTEFGASSIYYETATQPTPPTPPTPPSPGCITKPGKPGANTIKPWWIIW